jgi:hypothetical protein
MSGFALIALGSLLQIPALGCLTEKAEEARARGSLWLFWSLGNFSPEGQRILRRGWFIQAAGLGLLVASLFM